MDKLMDWLAKQPVWMKAVILIVVFGFLVYFVFQAMFNDGKKVEEAPREVSLQVQAASDKVKVETNMQRYDNQNNAVNTDIDPNAYWNSLYEQEDSAARASAVTGTGVADAGYLDPMKYSEMERFYISTGAATKAEVDAQHMRDSVGRVQLEQRRRKAKQDSQRERDSIYFARNDQAYRAAEKIFGPMPEERKEEAPVVKDTVEVRKIDISAATASTGGGNSSIISSLEEEADPLVLERKEGNVIPAKATFLKTESLVDGQRVVMRLMQELRLLNGAVIPANTHVSGLCSTSGGRLGISIRSLQYGGRIYHVDMCVFDSDGLEGIYCPVIESKKARKAGKSIARQVADGVTSTAASLFAASPVAMRIAQTGMNQMSQVAFEDGSVAVNVVSGYEFYVVENLKRR